MAEKLDVTDLFGHFGRYQFLFTLWVSYYGMFNAYSVLDINFLMPDMNYNCTDPGFTSKDDQCQTTVNGEAIDCSNWNYSSSFYGPHSTLTEKFNLVCNRQFYRSLSTSVQQIGDLSAGFIVSALSDRYGRRPACVLTLIPGAIGMLMFVFVEKIEWYLVAQFLNGVTGLSGFYLSTILLVEMSGKEWRGMLCIIAGTAGYSTGYALLAGIYYLIRNEHHYHIFLCSFYSVLILFYWVIPESPRWLLLNQRQEECFRLVKYIKTTNKLQDGRTDEDIKVCLKTLADDLQKEAIELQQSTSSNPLDLCRGFEMFKKTTIIFYAWFVSYAVYFGIALNADILGGNTYLNFFILGVVELPCMIVCIITERYFSRRILVSVSMFVSGVLYFLTIPVPPNYVSIRILMVILGKYFVTAAYNYLTPYTPELFPTSVRATGVGMSAGMGSLATIVAPFTAQLAISSGLNATFIIFGVLCVTSGISIWILPETKNIDLPDIMGNDNKLKTFAEMPVIVQQPKCTTIPFDAENYLNRKEIPITNIMD